MEWNLRKEAEGEPTERRREGYKVQLILCRQEKAGGAEEAGEVR